MPTNRMRRSAASAPGRVNLIGEHTDYNDGFVMPIAIEPSTLVEARTRSDRRLILDSQAYPGQEAAFELDALPDGPRKHWSAGLRGMIFELQRDGVSFPGTALHVTSTLPIGAGLGSSAALAIAAGLAMLDLVGVELDRDALARVAQRAENRHTGARSGIMDQFVSANAQANQALMLDTRSVSYELLPVAPDLRFIVFNTMVRHEHANGEYNTRREQCEAAVAILHEPFPHIRALRDATIGDLNAARDRMSPVLYRRCRHVITENGRVLAAAKALRMDDRAAFGRLMDASHASLRDDYEVSCPELDAMVAIARACPAAYGARMTGGGFGGCAIALVDEANADAIIARVRREYASAVGITPDAFAVTPCPGATIVSASAKALG
jgi:galactokinase